MRVDCGNLRLRDQAAATIIRRQGGAPRDEPTAILLAVPSLGGEEGRELVRIILLGEEDELEEHLVLRRTPRRYRRGKPLRQRDATGLR